MRLLLISLFCVIIFFPAYFVLHPVFGANWGSGIAILLSWILLPIFLLRKWSSTKSRLLIFGNYILALLVLAFSLFISYRWLIQCFELEGSIQLLFFYFYSSVYYLSQGRMSYQEDPSDGGKNT
jgi:hypothetical protein